MNLENYHEMFSSIINLAKQKRERENVLLIRLTWSRASKMDGYSLERNEATSNWPYKTALCNGVQPIWSRAKTIPFLSRRLRTSFKLPRWDDLWSSLIWSWNHYDKAKKSKYQYKSKRFTIKWLENETIKSNCCFLIYSQSMRAHF